MKAAAASDRQDRYLAAGCVATLMLLAGLSFGTGALDESDGVRALDAAAIGVLRDATGELRRRGPTELAWHGLRAGDPVFAADHVFAAAAAVGVLALRNGSTLVVRDNSLVVLDALAPPIDAAADRSPSDGQTLWLPDGGSSAATVRFKWSTPVSGRLVVTTLADKRERSVIVQDATEASLNLPTRGAHRWRIDADNSMVRERETVFILADDKPVALLSPRHQELYTAADGVSVPLRFAAMGGAVGYEVAIAADAKFERELSVRETRDSVALLAPPHEGTWYWRVRALRDGAPPSPWSATRSFRLTHRPVPGAPVLLDAEVDLDGE